MKPVSSLNHAVQLLFERCEQLPFRHLAHDLSVSHIAGGEVVVSGGLADFDEGSDRKLHAVFERADALMYQEKKLLKSLGAKTR